VVVVVVEKLDMSVRMSSARRVIMARRCSKEAGLGDLSAFWVARRRMRRRGEGYFGSERAEVAMLRWAFVGGLKEESRMRRVAGGNGAGIEGGGVMVCRTV
jgi:hypothetical protein